MHSPAIIFVPHLAGAPWVLFAGVLYVANTGSKVRNEAVAREALAELNTRAQKK